MAPACMCSPVPQPPSSQGKSGGERKGNGVGRGAQEESRKGDRGKKTDRNRQGHGEGVLAKVMLLAFRRQEVQ